MSDSVAPAMPDSGNITVQLSTKNGHRTVRAFGFDSEGYVLILGSEEVGRNGRLMRAVDHPRFLSANPRKHASEREQDVPAMPGWYCRITEIPENAAIRKLPWQIEVGEVYPVMLWRYLGPADVRPIIPRPLVGSGDQRGYDPTELGVLVGLFLMDE